MMIESIIWENDANFGRIWIMMLISVMIMDKPQVDIVVSAVLIGCGLHRILYRDCMY